MKTFLKMIVGAFGLLFLGLGAFFFLLSSKGEDVVRRFLVRASQATVTQVRDELLHPGLKDAVDLNCLAAAMKALATRYGAFKNTHLGEFKQEWVSGGTVHKVTSTFVFEKAQWDLTLEFMANQLTAFRFDDKLAAELAPVFEKVPEDTSGYVKQGEAACRLMIERKAAELWPLMSEPLQKQFGDQAAFTKLVQTQLPEAKQVESFALVRSAPEKEDPATLALVYQAKIDGTARKLRIRYEFRRMKCFLVSVSYPYEGE